MALYVDDMHRPWRRGKWSHLFADTPEELAAAARALGLRSEWLQHPGTYREHYDITDTNRARAFLLGASAITYPHGTAELLARKKTAMQQEKR